MRWWRCLALFAAVTEPADAVACTCAGHTLTVPASDAVGVPTNLRELIVPFATSGPYQLQPGSGVSVPLGPPEPVWPPPGGRAMRLALLAALDAGTTYQLLDEHGGVALQFQTGVGPDTEAPAGVDVRRIDARAVDVDIEDEHSTCSPPTYELTSFVIPPPDAALLLVELRGGGDDLVHVLDPAWQLDQLGDSTCAIATPLRRGVPYEISIWARDLAGNDGPATTQTFELPAASGCATQDDGGAGLVPLVAVAALVLRRRRTRGR